MKSLKRNIRRVTVLFLAMFLALGCYFSYAVYFYGNRWFSNAYNPRIHQAKQTISPGNILDRNGTLLAGTDANGGREYSSNAEIRKAFSHVIGDNLSIVSSGVETFHAGDLLGFNQGLISRLGQAVLTGGRRGSDVRLTLDSTLQLYAAKKFPTGKDGAVVLLNYKTGEILALYSSPAFDVNNVQSIASQGGSELVNRATQGQYAPGSIFKTVTLAAVLEALPYAAQNEYYCEGERDMGVLPMSDNDGEGHGSLTLAQAYNISCNLTFGQLGVDMGQSALRRASEAFGFNDNFLFRDLVVYSSKFPVETMEKSKLAWSAVGQGDLIVTPLHMAMIAGAIGNGGTMMEPLLVSSVSSDGGVDRSASPRVYKQSVTSAVAASLRDYMRGCVTDGTGMRAGFSGGTVCGKTGTAQTASSGQGVEPHSWFMGFNDDVSHPYAIAVIIEHGGAGSTHAAPLAGEILKKAVELNLYGN